MKIYTISEEKLREIVLKSVMAGLSYANNTLKGIVGSGEAQAFYYSFVDNILNTNCFQEVNTSLKCDICEDIMEKSGPGRWECPNCNERLRKGDVAGEHLWKLRAAKKEARVKCPDCKGDGKELGGVCLTCYGMRYIVRGEDEAKN